MTLSGEKLWPPNGGGLGTADSQRLEARQLPAEGRGGCSSSPVPTGRRRCTGSEERGREDDAWWLRLQRNAIPASPGGHCAGRCPTGQQALALEGHDRFKSAEVHRVRGKRPGLRLRWSHLRASSQSLLQVPLRMSHPRGDSGWASSGSSPGEQRGRAPSPDSRPESSLLPWPTFCWPPGRGFSAPTLQPTEEERVSGQPPHTVQHWQEKAGSQQSRRLALEGRRPTRGTEREGGVGGM